MRVAQSWIKPRSVKKNCQVLDALRLRKERSSLIITLERVAANPASKPCRVSYAQRWLAELRS